MGGNDGVVNDLIFKCVKRYGWEGIILEPQREVFETRLTRTYRNERKVILENLAIAGENGTRKLYKLSISNSRWATGLATFDKKTLESQIRKNYVDKRARKEGIATPDKMEDYITFEEVTCITIGHLLQRHNWQALDLLHIDTEGYDFEIIKTIDFTALKPRIIIFENEHLSTADFQACQDLLRQHGYSLEQQDRDSLAYLS